jgi:hypothetical protein
MNERLESILSKMSQLEQEFHGELKSCEERFQQCFVASVAELKRSAQDAQQRLGQKTSKLSTLQFWKQLASIPFIYVMIVPLVFMDFMLTIYQQVCFRLYGVPLARRGEHFIIDRQLLDNLNLVDKLNCIFCGYGSGIFSYGREIVSKTEQYWCPIKHAQKTHAAAARYSEFLEYGDTEEYHNKVAEYREDLKKEE